jgi:hypothetical protein
MHDGDPPRARPDGSGPRADTPGPAPDPPAAGLAALAQDWITVWQSELTAAAADRELQETWQRLAAIWAGVAGAMLQGLPRGPFDGSPSDRTTAGHAGSAAPARTAPAAAAPDPRDAEIDRLGDRIAELERRLAELERRSGRDVGNRGSTDGIGIGRHGSGRRPTSGAG